MTVIPSVSRRHSQIDKEEDQFVIRDLDSLNGTFINDVPVKRRALQHGDRVRIGDSQFLFLMHDGEVKSQSSEVKFHDDLVVSGSTFQVRFNDALYLMARDLSALMKVSTTINAIRGIEELQKTLLELLFEVVPAERGAVLLTSGSAESEDAQFGSVFGLDRLRGPDESIRVSRTITRSVMGHGESVLINQAETKGLAVFQVRELERGWASFRRPSSFRQSLIQDVISRGSSRTGTRFWRSW